MQGQNWRVFPLAGEVWVAQRRNTSPVVEVKGELWELPSLIIQAEVRKVETGSYWPREMRLIRE